MREEVGFVEYRMISAIEKTWTRYCSNNEIKVNNFND